MLPCPLSLLLLGVVVFVELGQSGASNLLLMAPTTTSVLLCASWYVLTTPSKPCAPPQHQQQQSTGQNNEEAQGVKEVLMETQEPSTKRARLVCNHNNKGMTDKGFLHNTVPALHQPVEPVPPQNNQQAANVALPLQWVAA